MQCNALTPNINPRTSHTSRNEPARASRNPSLWPCAQHKRGSARSVKNWLSRSKQDRLHDWGLVATMPYPWTWARGNKVCWTLEVSCCFRRACGSQIACFIMVPPVTPPRPSSCECCCGSKRAARSSYVSCRTLWLAPLGARPHGRCRSCSFMSQCFSTLRAGTTVSAGWLLARSEHGAQHKLHADPAATPRTN